MRDFNLGNAGYSVQVSFNVANLGIMENLFKLMEDTLDFYRSILQEKRKQNNMLPRVEEFYSAKDA